MLLLLTLWDSYWSWTSHYSRPSTRGWVESCCRVRVVSRLRLPYRSSIVKFFHHLQRFANQGRHYRSAIPCHSALNLCTLLWTMYQQDPGLSSTLSYHQWSVSRRLNHMYCNRPKRILMGFYPKKLCVVSDDRANFHCPVCSHPSYYTPTLPYLSLIRWPSLMLYLM